MTASKSTKIMSKKHRILNLNLSDYLYSPSISQLKKMKNQILTLR